MKSWFLFTVLTILWASALTFAQKAAEPGSVKSSAAYAEVVLRRAELQAEIEAVLADYTEQNPKVLDIRFELAALERSIGRLLGVKPPDTAKLTLSLGKLVIKRVSYETDLNRLLRSYAPENSEVKRARRRFEIFDAAVKELLP